MKNKILGLMAGAALLTSCAPAQMGSAAYVPLDASKGQVAAFAGGGTWYVKTDAVRFDIPQSVRQNTFNGLFGYDDVTVGMKVSTTVNWLSLKESKLPEGWSLELAKQTATRQIVSVRQDGDTKYYLPDDSIEPVFALMVPGGTPEGVFQVSAELGSSYGSSTRVLSFNVRVQPKPVQ